VTPEAILRDDKLAALNITRFLRVDELRPTREKN